MLYFNVVREVLVISDRSIFVTESEKIHYDYRGDDAEDIVKEITKIIRKKC